MKIVISLIWIRENASGGVESYTHNILDGLANSGNRDNYVLLCSDNNYKSFIPYSNDKRFIVIHTHLNTRHVLNVLFFESFLLDRYVRKFSADICFVPCYRMPMFFSKAKYVVTIHDLIAYHLPDNFKWYRRIWLQFAWKRSCIRAHKIVAISNHVKDDIVNRFNIDPQKIEVIYNPILPNIEVEPFPTLSDKFKIEKYEYFYTVSSMMKHKNLLTVLGALLLVKTRYPNRTPKLVVSGVGQSGPEAKSHFITNEIFSFISENNLEDVCILTGYVSNERRNSLMKNAKAFLFPSLYEGFGMPPIEALTLGTPVITTKCGAIPEVTKDKCYYVENSLSEAEWAEYMVPMRTYEREVVAFPDCSMQTVTDKYVSCFYEIK